MILLVLRVIFCRRGWGVAFPIGRTTRGARCRCGCHAPLLSVLRGVEELVLAGQAVRNFRGIVLRLGVVAVVAELRRLVPRPPGEGGRRLEGRLALGLANALALVLSVLPAPVLSLEPGPDVVGKRARSGGAP